MVTTGCEPSHRHSPIVSHCHNDEVRDIVHLERYDRSRGENGNQFIRADALRSWRSSQGGLAESTTASTPYAMHSRRTASFEEQKQTSRPRRRPRISDDPLSTAWTANALAARHTWSRIPPSWSISVQTPEDRSHSKEYIGSGGREVLLNSKQGVRHSRLDGAYPLLYHV